MVFPDATHFRPFLGAVVVSGRELLALFSRPESNWESVIPRPCATFAKLEKLRLDSPRSMVPIKVLWTPQWSAKSSCE
jgi:hypothetical protein